MLKLTFSKKTLLSLAGIIFGAILFDWALHNTDAAGACLTYVWALLTPFLLGGVIAFIMNVPMRALERRLRFKNPKLQKLRRPLAWLATLLAILLLLALVVSIVIPQVVVTLQTISAQAMHFVKTIRPYLEMLPEDLAALFPGLEDNIKDLGDGLSILSRHIAGVLENAAEMLISGVNILGTIISGIATLFISFIFSIYLLFGKERLADQAKRVLYALLPAARADKLIEVLRLANRTFSNFITGQCLEACILGLLFFVAMLIFRLPYVTLTAVLIAVTALVPIFGAFVGCVLSMLFIALEDPLQALGFLVLFLALQQFEGNVIYPRVVGNSVGLPAIWVLVAISLGGGLFGVVGMLTFVPLCSVAYAVFRQFVNDRLAAKQIPPEKWQN